eukprot:6325151-Amphidinium_carterae.6
MESPLIGVHRGLFRTQSGRKPLTQNSTFLPIRHATSHQQLPPSIQSWTALDRDERTWRGFPPCGPEASTDNWNRQSLLRH